MLHDSTSRMMLGTAPCQNQQQILVSQLMMRSHNFWVRHTPLALVYKQNCSRAGGMDIV